METQTPSVTDADPVPGNPAVPVPPAADLPPQAVLEALLFGSDAPVPLATLADIVDVPPARLRELIEALRAEYAAANRAFGIEEINGGFQLLTHPEFAPWLNRLKPGRKAGKLSPAALETLSIIAYKQPVTRAEIESIRGVQAGPILRTLLDRDLVRTSGRAEVLGSPLLYATTDRFLESHGLKSLEDLPQFSDFRNAIPPALPAESTPPTENA